MSKKNETATLKNIETGERIQKETSEENTHTGNDNQIINSSIITKNSNNINNNTKIYQKGSQTQSNFLFIHCIFVYF